MALKSRSVQLPEEVWEFLSFKSEQSNLSVSAMVRTIISTSITEYFFNDFMPRFKKAMPDCTINLPPKLINEMLSFMDIKDISISGTIEEQKKQMTALFAENKELLNETINYIDKRGKYVDDETILSWTGVPKITHEGVTVSNAPTGGR